MFFKVKVSHIRLGQVLKVPTNSKRLAQDGGKVVSHKHRPPLPVMRYPWYSFTLEPKSASQPGAVGRIVNEKKPPLFNQESNTPPSGAVQCSVRLVATLARWPAVPRGLSGAYQQH